jgi:hypothetical protein
LECRRERLLALLVALLEPADGAFAERTGQRRDAPSCLDRDPYGLFLAEPCGVIASE